MVYWYFLIKFYFFLIINILVYFLSLYCYKSLKKMSLIVVMIYSVESFLLFYVAWSSMNHDISLNELDESNMIKRNDNHVNDNYKKAVDEVKSKLGMIN